MGGQLNRRSKVKNGILSRFTQENMKGPRFMFNKSG